MTSKINPVSKEVLIREAAKLLREGKLVAFPTETVYGLGADAMDAVAVLRIYAAKGRPATSPLIVHVADVAAARALASEWPAVAEKLAAAFWPGPLTIVVKKIAGVPDEVTAGLNSVGLRVPAHPMALALLREAGIPIAAPSANRFTQLSPTRAEHVREGLGDAVDLVLDGGPCQVGIESTVVSVVGGTVVLLRPGMISRASLEEVVGPVGSVGDSVDGEAHAAPGMHRKHYSPQTPLRVGVPEGSNCGYLWHSVPPKSVIIHKQLPNDPDGYAAGLYDALHELDRAGMNTIYAEPLPSGAEWDAIRDRLTRAAE